MMKEYSRTSVSISKIYDGRILDAVRTAVDHIGGFGRYVKPGDTVILKPNLAYPYPPPATTDPRTVKAAAILAFEAGASRVYIGDSSAYSCKKIIGVGRWTNRDVIEKTGMALVAQETGATIVDFDEDEFVMKDIPDGVILQRAPIARKMLDTDVVINMPALKTHFETQVTLAIKNFHGILPDHYKVQWHKDEIMQKVVDLHKVVKTDLVILDGIVGMQGLGPRCGTSVSMDVIMASSDVVSLDAVACEVMGITSWSIESTRIAHTQGIGNGRIADIEVKGDTIASVKKSFEHPDVSIDGIYPGLTIIKGGPCGHCYGRTRIMLDALAAMNMSRNGGVSTVFVGINPKQIDLDRIKGKALFIGDCAISTAANLRYALGTRAICVDGCPPIASVHRELDRLQSDSGGEG
jgi:uncharacterized protein (DUF362 family)